MKKFLLITSFLVLGGCVSYKPPEPFSGVNSGRTSLSYDETWEAAIDFFANSGIPLKNVEKDSGLIAAEYGLAAHESQIDCGTTSSAGAILDRFADINVLVRDEGGYVDVRVNVFGRGTLFDSFNNQRSAIRCVSTGELEELLLRHLSAI